MEGPRLAGTTRTLTKAAQSCLPEHLAAGFIDDPRVPLEDVIAQAGRWASSTQTEAAGAVVWLDSLTPERFVELASVTTDQLPPGVWVLACLDTEELDGLRIPEQVSILLERHAIRIQLRTVTDDERSALLAEGTYAALRPVLEQDGEVFLGRLMVAWEPLRAALTRGGSEQGADRVALLRATTDWYRVHLPRVLDKDILGHLYRAYRRDLTGAPLDSPVSAAAYSDALRWAMAAPSADNPRLLDLQDVPGAQRYAPHPLLAVLADDPGETASWPVSHVLWSYADRFFGGNERRDIGYTALHRGARHAAARMLSHTDSTIAPCAYNQIAALFYQHAEWADSRKWWQKAVSSGHPEEAPRAMVNLGELEVREGNLDQARHWYQEAINSAHPDQAPRAMVNLGSLDEANGDLRQARHWWQKAVRTRHPNQAPVAMVNLGVLEVRQGHFDQARDWYQQAIRTGHPDQAPQAMYNLGVLEMRQNKLNRARHWWREAISTGHPDHAPIAMVNLGVLEKQVGDLDQARHWYQEAISTGHADEAPRAMVNLGNLDIANGDLRQALHWWQEAISTGHPDEAPKAIFNVGLQEMQQGNLDRARDLFRQAISTGHPDEAPKAICSLGLLEAERGNLDQAREWYQQAVETKHPDFAAHAKRELRALDQREDARERGEYFARHGYDPAPMRQARQHAQPSPSPDPKD
jgi:tetratricopeptide (TPR) repeat protein